MAETLLESLTRTLRYQRAPTDITKVFRGWKHNADILPKLQSQVEMLLESYGKFMPIVYDTQGILDDGSDLVLRYRPEDSDKEYELICFQVKSFDDLSKKTYLQELKAQRDDSFRKVVGLHYYFILLCTDSQVHRERVRSIVAEFRSASKTEVIEPAYAFTFLHHPQTRIDALVKRAMESGDLVFRMALDSLSFPSPSARALAVFIAIKSVLTGQVEFSTDKLHSESALQMIYEELRVRQEDLVDMYNQAVVEKATLPEETPKDTDANDDDFHEDEDEDEEPMQLDEFDGQLAKDLAILECEMIDLNSSSGNIVLRTDQIRALNAVISDALARYDYNEQQLVGYMFSLMGIRD